MIDFDVGVWGDGIKDGNNPGFGVDSTLKYGRQGVCQFATETVSISGQSGFGVKSEGISMVPVDKIG